MSKRSPKPDDIAPRLLAWFDRARRDLPWRRTGDPYHIWVAEIMLQQTQVNRVILYYQRFVRAFPTPVAVAAAPLDDILRLWAGLGYYSRARNLHAACKAVVARHSGRFPESYADAIALPGIGAYTAGAILSIAFGQPLPAIDANARRVLSRVFLDHGAEPTRPSRDPDLLSLAAVPQHRPGDYNQALMELGAVICVPRRPRCHDCCLADLCRARRQGRQHSMPAPNRRETRTGRAALAVVQRRGRVLIAQRALEGVWAGLWEFPNLELSMRDTPRRALERLLSREFGICAAAGKEIAQLTYSIMDRRIRLIAYACGSSCGRTKPRRHLKAVWVRTRDIGLYALPAPHRRLADVLLKTCSA